MSGHTGNDVQASCVGYTKTKTSITTLVPTAEIRELEWQGTTFSYPNVRVSVDFYPAVNGCQDRADVVFDIFSEEKSSNQASAIAGAIYSAYHRKPFTFLGVNFFMVIVQKVDKPTRTIYGWQSKVTVSVLLT